MSNVVKCVQRVRFLGQGGMSPADTLAAFTSGLVHSYQAMMDHLEFNLLLVVNNTDHELLVYDKDLAKVVDDALRWTRTNFVYADTTNMPPLDLDAVQARIAAGKAGRYEPELKNEYEAALKPSMN